MGFLDSYQRPVDFVAGETEVTAARLNGLQDGLAEQINVAIGSGSGSGSGGGGGGHTIEGEGVAVTQRTVINFTGAGVNVADQANKTVVTIAGTTNAASLTTGTLAAERLPNVPVKRLLRFSRVECFGHSYGAGYLLAAPATSRAIAKLTRALVSGGSNEQESFFNMAVSSARLLAATTGAGVAAGGWTKIGANLTRSRLTAPDLPGSQLGVLWYGINDITEMSVAQRTKYLPHGFRYGISQFLLSRRFENDHASVSYDAAWNGPFNATTAYSTGGSVHRVTAAGSTAVATISVPADFPGGTVAVGMVVATNGGAVLTYAADGSPQGSIDTTDLTFQMGGLNTAVPIVKRITGLAPGAHTITVTVTGGLVANAPQFDWWGIEVPMARSPLVLVCNQPRIAPAGYAQYASRPFPIAHADIDQLNSIIASVVAEYANPRVKVVDLTHLGYPTQPTYWLSEGLHLNELGHVMAAVAQLDAVSESDYTSADALFATP